MLLEILLKYKHYKLTRHEQTFVDGHRMSSTRIKERSDVQCFQGFQAMTATASLFSTAVITSRGREAMGAPISRNMCCSIREKVPCAMSVLGRLLWIFWIFCQYTLHIDDVIYRYLHPGNGLGVILGSTCLCWRCFWALCRSAWYPALLYGIDVNCKRVTEAFTSGNPSHEE